jgi:hypothetical protein
MVAFRGATAAALLAAVPALLFTSAGWSQQKYQLKQWESEASYVEERAIDAKDVPGHQVRIYQLKATYPKKDLVFLGVPVVESTTTGISDYTNWSGQFSTYGVYTLEDGSRIITKGGGSNQSDPSGARRFSYIENLIGGTGRFRGIRGQIRGNGERAAGAKSISETSSGEYWIEE